MKRKSLCCLLLMLLAACAAAPPENSPKIREIASPAGATNSGEPELFVTTRGEAILSWLEKIDEKTRALKFSILRGDAWDAPRVVVQADNLFVNWADFPSVIELTDGSLAAHWLVNNAQKSHAYDVFIARSFDGGANWTPAAKPHTDDTATEHGFVSLVALPDGNLGAFWLDGRKYDGETHAALDAPRFIQIHDHAGHNDAKNETMLRYAVLDKTGKLTNEAELDSRVCDCCQTAAAQTAAGLLVMYRDRSAEERRDFSIVRQSGGAWTKPQSLHDDGWIINGCPVNGAALAAAGQNAAAAWFTNANEQPQVKLSFSTDAGATFTAPVRVDDGAAQGRVDVVLLADNSAIVSWLAGTNANGKINLRRVAPDGKLGEITTVAETSINRASGFPRLIRAGNRVVIAWTAGEKPSRVRTAVLNL